MKCNVFDKKNTSFVYFLMNIGNIFMKNKHAYGYQFLKNLLLFQCPYLYCKWHYLPGLTRVSNEHKRKYNGQDVATFNVSFPVEIL